VLSETLAHLDSVVRSKQQPCVRTKVTVNKVNNGNYLLAV